MSVFEGGDQGWGVKVGGQGHEDKVGSQGWGNAQWFEGRCQGREVKFGVKVGSQWNGME